MHFRHEFPKRNKLAVCTKNYSGLFAEFKSWLEQKFYRAIFIVSTMVSTNSAKVFMFVRSLYENIITYEFPLLPNSTFLCFLQLKQYFVHLQQAEKNYPCNEVFEARK